jgi:hypothetical protein
MAESRPPCCTSADFDQTKAGQAIIASWLHLPHLASDSTGLVVRTMTFFGFVNYEENAARTI